MAGEDQIRVLELAYGEDYSCKVFRLKKGWRVCFSLDPILQTHSVRMFCNHPVNDRTSFQYSELKWDSEFKLEGFNEVSEVITLSIAGSFNFFYTVDGSDDVEKALGSGYFIVDPELEISTEPPTKFNLDSLQIHTVLPKLLGPFPDWKNRLLVSAKSGYNMIHFTPLQKLNSESNSSYSISDQLAINPRFSTADRTYTLKDVASLVQSMNTQWGVLSMTDMVYNHTANDSAWITGSPDSAYNLSNSPHLKPAFLIDRAVVYLSEQIADNQLVEKGVSRNVNSEEHLRIISEELRSRVDSLKLEEFYILDVERIITNFTVTLQELLKTVQLYKTNEDGAVLSKPELHIIQDKNYVRLQSTIDVKSALRQYTDYMLLQKSKGLTDHVIIYEVTSALRPLLSELNQSQTSILEAHMDAAVNNVISGIKYRFVEENGPKLEAVTSQEPLVDEYFTFKGTCSPSKERDLNFDESLIADPSSCKLIMAHNGWVMNDDPLKNFAESGSTVYLRRELVVWGDSIKLRYGTKPSDSPDLWKRMEEYTKETVEIFHAIRLDNCHSTPIHVAEHMLKLGRSIRPDLYVIAELFTSQESLDNLFVNRLGINSLVREGLSAWDAHEQGRLVYKYGGESVGSFTQPNCQIVEPTTAHAILMDVTHDNESVIEKRTAADSLSLSAFVSMACCATGSSRGHDELIPHHIHVVTEERYYTSWTKQAIADNSTVDFTTGIILAKSLLNSIHKLMGANQYSQVYVHDLGFDVVSITRHNPHTHKSIICVVRSSFTDDLTSTPNCQPLKYEGKLSEVLLHAELRKSKDQVDFVKDPVYLNGLQSHILALNKKIKISEVKGLKWSRLNEKEEMIEFEQFRPGSVLIIKVLPDESLIKIRNSLLKSVSTVNQIVTNQQLDADGLSLGLTMSNLTLNDFNKILYRCEAEELSASNTGAYDVPNYGKLVYIGLQGILSPMSPIRTDNDLGHPICNNLREGDWLLDYFLSYFKKYPSLQQFGDWVRSMFDNVRQLPRYLVPCYFDIVLVAISQLINFSVWNRMPEFVRSGSSLVRQLALSSLQFCGSIPSAKPAPVSEKLIKRHPITNEPDTITISAGLPHFSEGVFRNWGRDTFISLRGLLLVTGRYEEAKSVILSYAGTLRHGLIPNLLGEGISARYNCRDAVWWWLQSVQDYYNMADNGHEILDSSVLKMYPTDECEPQIGHRNGVLLKQVIQEVVQRHSKGVEFRERNAGTGIDEHMTDSGFNVQIGVDWKTGFVFGGNQFNCGTWMDKMGSNTGADNRGKPATPRNGSAVELIGLCYSTVRWLAYLHSRNVYPFNGVMARRSTWNTDAEVSFDVWKSLIEKNFEKYFWLDATYTSMNSESRQDLIHKRNIYKDSLNSSPEWADYQLRPNFPIAMTVAPELFTTSNAMLALDSVEKYLNGPIGLKTLDPDDLNYRGDYINSDDSGDPTVASGFNYHNGPEWLWPVGYYLRAQLIMAKRVDVNKPGYLDDVIKAIHNKLSFHHVALQQSDWKSLPELTNSNGQPCNDGAPAQAWSIACIMDVLYDIHKLKSS